MSDLTSEAGWLPWKKLACRIVEDKKDQWNEETLRLESMKRRLDHLRASHASNDAIQKQVKDIDGCVHYIRSIEEWFLSDRYEIMKVATNIDGSQIVKNLNKNFYKLTEEQYMDNLENGYGAVGDAWRHYPSWDDLNAPTI